MRYRVIFFLILFSTILISQEKVSIQLQKFVKTFPSSDDMLVWVFFKDKDASLRKYTSENVLSKKSLARREKISALLDISDYPVSHDYIQKLSSLGFKLKHTSKWFNAVSGYVNKTELELIEDLSFVSKIDLVAKYKREKEIINEKSNPALKLQSASGLNYGESYTQLQQINVPAVHELGITGQGVTICVLDAGFHNLDHEVFDNMNIIAKWDFVNNDQDVGDGNDQGNGSHGTATLSAIGGFKEGELIGPAYNSTYILAKTENTFSETPVEEDNWIAALEWADSIGVDVTSTSLGYLDYEAPHESYTWESLDGNTTRITIAADLAVSKGIVVLNSAGNEGDNPNHNTLGAPADGDSVIAVGSVGSDGTRSGFSSVGPTADGRTKPDIMAMGSGVKLAGSKNLYYFGSGTSFSCPLAAGVAALILSAHPELNPMQVRDALRNTASININPDNLYGWGIVDALAAVNYFGAVKVDQDPKLSDYKLFQNYPNPFNPSTKIKFYVPENSNVKLELFDILGTKLATLADNHFSAGIHEKEININQTSFNLSSGIYLVRMSSGNFRNSIKITVVK